MTENMFTNIALTGLLGALKLVWWLIPIALLILITRTPMFKGWFGEKLLAFSIKKIIQKH